MSSLAARRRALRSQVNDDFAQLKDAVDELGAAVNDKTDVGRHMQKKPYAWLGCTVLVGVALGLVHASLKA